MIHFFKSIHHDSDHQVFVSYSFEDNNIMKKLKKTLQSNGIKCYVAEHDENYGNSLSAKLSDAIDDSKAVIVILTKKGSMSLSVGQEIGYAKKARKQVIPLLEKNVDLPVMLQGLEYISFDAKNIDIACDKITKFLTKKFNDIHKSDYKSDTEYDDETFDESIMLDNGEHQIYSYDLDEDDKIVGKIKSSMPINVFVVSNYGLRLFNSDKEFNFEDGGERIKRIKINFETYKGGSWHVIIENEDSDEAEVDIYLQRK